MVGDHVLDDVWDCVVDEVVGTPVRMEFWGVDEPGLMLAMQRSRLGL